jgi:hypothetical protein
VTGAALAWVDEARVLVTDPDASLERVASWLGDGVEHDEDGLRAGAGAVPGAETVTVRGRDGTVDLLAAWYSGTTGPTLAEAEEALGAATELPRLAATPPQVAFPAYRGEGATCFIAGTTWDPPEDGPARRLFQLTLRRDPL